MDVEIIVTICLVLILSVIAHIKGVFDKKGMVFAFLFGLIIGFISIYWLLLLAIILFSSFLATKYEFHLKESIGVQEGKKGERGVKNIFFNGMPLIVISLFYYFSFMDFITASLLFTVGMAVLCSDTLASELGVFYKAYLITNLKEVPPGTDGGISKMGEIYAFIGALAPSLIAMIIFLYGDVWTFNIYYIIYPTILGFVGCQIDSLLGATLERKGHIGKGMVNLISIFVSMLIMYFLLILL